VAPGPPRINYRLVLSIALISPDTPEQTDFIRQRIVRRSFGGRFGGFCSHIEIEEDRSGRPEGMVWVAVMTRSARPAKPQ
jgi:hypothetical protein